MGSLSLLQGIFPGIETLPGIEPWFPTLQADSLLAEPQAKPKNTGVGSLSLLQWIFLTQELSQGLLLQVDFYQLSYQFWSSDTYVRTHFSAPGSQFIPLGAGLG